jgi:hypothetical protein
MLSCICFTVPPTCQAQVILSSQQQQLLPAPAVGDAARLIRRHPLKLSICFLGTGSVVGTWAIPCCFKPAKQAARVWCMCYGDGATVLKLGISLLKARGAVSAWAVTCCFKPAHKKGQK